MNVSHSTQVYCLSIPAVVPTGVLKSFLGDCPAKVQRSHNWFNTPQSEQLLPELFASCLSKEACVAWFPEIS